MEIKSIDNTKFYLPATMTTQNKSSKNMLHQKTIKEQLKHNSNNYSTGEKLIAGAGVIVLIAGIIKGKSIIKLFKNSKIETNLNSEMQIVTTGKNKNNGRTTLYFPEPTKEQLLKHYENLQEQQGTYAVRLENQWTKEDKDKYREVTNILVSVEKQIQRLQHSRFSDIVATDKNRQIVKVNRRFFAITAKIFQNNTFYFHNFSFEKDNKTT